MQHLLELSHKMGYEAFPSLRSAPYLNEEFMEIVPNCEFGDDKGCKLRTKMYRNYIKGWVKGHLDKVFNAK